MEIVTGKEAYLNLKQYNNLKEVIEEELLKRGFTAKIKQFNEAKRGDYHWIEFETEEFNTTPVIFKSIKISNSSSSINLEDSEDGQHAVVKVWIGVNVRWSHFGGGSNGTKLFDLTCKFEYGDVYRQMYNLRIR